jgi:hypothetical protein
MPSHAGGSARSVSARTGLSRQLGLPLSDIAREITDSPGELNETITATSDKLINDWPRWAAIGSE